MIGIKLCIVKDHAQPNIKIRFIVCTYYHVQFFPNNSLILQSKNFFLMTILVISIESNTCSSMSASIAGRTRLLAAKTDMYSIPMSFNHCSMDVRKVGLLFTTKMLMQYNVYSFNSYLINSYLIRRHCERLIKRGLSRNLRP